MGLRTSEVQGEAGGVDGVVGGGGHCPVHSLPFILPREVIFQRLGDSSFVAITSQ